MMDPRQRYLRIGLIAAGGLVLAILAVALAEHFGSALLSGRSSNGGVGLATVGTAPPKPDGQVATMSLHDAPRMIPDLQFEDSSGRNLTLADFRGTVVLLNIWATWCGPCREEMPTLDRLQAELGGPDFQVVALSIDRAGLRVVSEFYDEIGIAHLRKYIDESGKASRQLNAMGLPTTLLIDRESREIARHVGPAEWDTPEMVEFFRRQLSRESGALWSASAGKGAQARETDPVVRSTPHKALRAALPDRGRAIWLEDEPVTAVHRNQSRR